MFSLDVWPRGDQKGGCQVYQLTKWGQFNSERILVLARRKRRAEGRHAATVVGNEAHSSIRRHIRIRPVRPAAPGYGSLTIFPTASLTGLCVTSLGATRSSGQRTGMLTFAGPSGLHREGKLSRHILDAELYGGLFPPHRSCSDTLPAVPWKS